MLDHIVMQVWNDNYEKVLLTSLPCTVPEIKFADLNGGIRCQKFIIKADGERQ